MPRGGTNKPGEPRRGLAAQNAAREARIARFRSVVWTLYRAGRLDPTFVEMGRESGVSSDTAAAYARILIDRADYPPFRTLPRKYPGRRQMGGYVKPGPPPTPEQIAVESAKIRAERAASGQGGNEHDDGPKVPIRSRSEHLYSFRRAGWSSGQE
jgi:hypothetical protein